MYKGTSRNADYKVGIRHTRRQPMWDELSASRITEDLMRVWYASEEYVRNIGPGTLILGAMVVGVVYYSIVRPR